MRVGKIGLQGDSLLESCRGLIELALVPKDVAQVVVRHRKIRPQSQCLPKPCRGLIELADSSSKRLPRLFVRSA